MKTFSIVFLLQFLAYQVKNFELRFVYSFFAEGLSGPEKVGEDFNDYFGEFWANPRDLTALGARMHYLIGRRNRDNYRFFLSQDFKYDEVYVKAIDERNTTIASAQAQLQGMYYEGVGPQLNQRDMQNLESSYPPSTPGNKFNQEKLASYQKLNSTLGSNVLPGNTVLAPIHTLSPFDRHNYEYWFRYCHDYQNLLEKTYDENELYYNNMIQGFLNIYGDVLTKALNLDSKTELEEYDFLIKVAENFVLDYEAGRELRRVRNQGVNMVDLYDRFRSILRNHYFSYLNQEERELFYPEIVWQNIRDEFHEWLENRIENDQERYERSKDGDSDYLTSRSNQEYLSYVRPKIVLNSVMRRQVAALYVYLSDHLELQKMSQVRYGSNVYFELYRPDNYNYSGNVKENYRVRVLNNDYLLWDGTYTDFYNALFTSNWSNDKVLWECSKNILDYYGFKNSTIVLGVLLGVTVLLLIFVLLCCVCCYQKKNSNVSQENDADEGQKLETKKSENENRETEKKNEDNKA